MLIQKNKMAGMSIVEVVLATAVLLFVSYAGLNILSSSAITTTALSKKVALSDDLDDRVGEYTVLKKEVGSGSTFDVASDGNIDFSKNDITSIIAPNNDGYIINEFKATEDGIEVNQRELHKS